MLNKLISLAEKYFDEYEIYEMSYSVDGVSFENRVLKEIESKIQTGISIRGIKDGKLAFAYTKNLLDPEEFIDNALASLKGEIEAGFSFPKKYDLPTLNTYDPNIEDITNTKLVEESKRVSEILYEKTNTQINLGAGKGVVSVHILNSNGVDYQTKSSFYNIYAAAMYPGSYASVDRLIADKKFKEFSKEDIDYITLLFNNSKREVKPKGGRMKVLFLPDTMYVLIWRLVSATCGRNIYEKTSPLINRLGEKIFDSSLTIYDDPLNDDFPDARSFDDEGVACRFLPIVEDGVLKNFYYDLYYAAKLNTESTGHGYREGDESIRERPSPSLHHLFVKPGKSNFYDMIKSMDKGVIVPSALGAHSGNILNGDFSIGLAPGLYVENGEIVGHIKDSMAAGNIYEVMKNVVDIENRVYLSNMGIFPSVIFENVSVAIKE